MLLSNEESLFSEISLCIFTKKGEGFEKVWWMDGKDIKG
jgi:hypothetical protein